MTSSCPHRYPRAGRHCAQGPPLRAEGPHHQAALRDEVRAVWHKAGVVAAQLHEGALSAERLRRAGRCTRALSHSHTLLVVRILTSARMP